MAFLLIAGLLFAVNAIVSPEDFMSPPDRITVSAGRVIQLAESYRLLTGSPPTSAELRNLIADFIDEEIAYREAVAMDLDRNDTVIRRRLRQKFEFMRLDAAAVDAPTVAELRAWHRQHRERYRVPERRALRVATFLADRGAPVPRAQEALAKLHDDTLPGGVGELGDSSLLPGDLPLTTETGVARQFGARLAGEAFAAPTGAWVGPIPSSYGAHLIYVLETAAPNDPPFDDLRRQLREDWTREQETEALERIRRKLRSRYEVVVNWPGARSERPQWAQSSAAE